LIVIVASRWDDSARALAGRWAGCDARVMTPRDLSRPGWRQRFGSSGRIGDGTGSTLVVDGRIEPQDRVAGVLTRLAGVAEQELGHIEPADRAYVAAEMTAFLLGWLASLTCPVVNRPTPACLTGPGWGRERWALLAARSGMLVEPIRSGTFSGTCSRTSAVGTAGQPDPGPDACSVTVAGESCFSEADPQLREQARRLARLAGVEVLGVRFTSPASSSARFLGVDLQPEITGEPEARAVLETLLSAKRAAR